MQIENLIYEMLHLSLLISYQIIYTEGSKRITRESIDSFIQVRKPEALDEQCRSYAPPRYSNRQKMLLSFPGNPLNSTEDPSKVYEEILHFFLFGPKVHEKFEIESDMKKLKLLGAVDADPLIHYPSGHIFRGEIFLNKSSVHLPILKYIQRGHCRLNITKDRLQTAVNAFAIFLQGSIEDVLNLPPNYVLQSARTIAMLKIAREKLAATWTVVKAGRFPEEIEYETLEMYRPLFKYINGKEIARLNLSDTKILTFIGTHPDLNRHQVGVVASRYIKENKNWMEPKYLNLMNNLLCGVPMTYMRRIVSNIYLQLTHQVFYHIRACDPLQRRFYLAMMTRTQALGKSYSWSARDVSRLGLLLAEVDGADISAINPEAMSGITAQVMLKMPPENLQHITEMQLRYIRPKPLNILTKKLKLYEDQIGSSDGSYRMNCVVLNYIVVFILGKAIS